MKTLRNTTQMKEQTRNTEVQINKEEIGKLPEKEFRIMIVKMTKNLENKMEKMKESINKDLEAISSRISEAEKWISELEDKMMEIPSEEQNKVKTMKRTEDSLRDLWDNIKPTNIRIIQVPEEEEKKKGYEKFFEEIIVENFPNMEKEIVNQV